ncbi:MAG: VapB-type antitoxin [Nitrososphaerales archaeon]
MSTVISVRVRKEIKEELEKAGVDVAEEIKEKLEELAWKVRTKRQVERWNKILNRVKPSEKGFSVKSVREDRESH